MASVAVPNETRSEATRVTKDGRKLTYMLHVIQQPERARACGSGAKSSADRRPVDPPPIVELRVFDGAQDITFSYNAQFFLYATLENSRQIAQGRVPSTPNSFPVLTGTPVAGIAYLDRPVPAGYFIFPDLSVRHEGKYRLSFSLYEQYKNNMDADPDSVTDPSGVRQEEPHVVFRLDVRSQPFTVYSAKKFPGLTESTQLSRMVAEQGCRVRIRRDVRMRRRENKVDKDWDGYEDETAYERAKRNGTPGHYDQSGIATPQPSADAPDRPRSVSNASVASFAVPPQRRPSSEQLAQQYQQQYPTGAVPSAPPQQAYQPFPQYPSQPQYAPQYQPQQPTYMQQGMMQPPQVPVPPTHNGYVNNGYQHMPPPQHYAPTPYDPAGHQRSNSLDYSQQANDTRRPSGPQQQPQPYMQNQMVNGQYGNMDYTRHQPMAQPATSMAPMQQPIAPRSTTPVPPAAPAALAPLKTQLAVDKSEQPLSSPAYSTPISAHMSADSLSGQNSANGRYFSGSDNSMYQSRPVKRSYGESFGEQPHEPLRQGARPMQPPARPSMGVENGIDEGDEYEPPMERSAMSYRRADGTERRRTMPAL